MALVTLYMAASFLMASLYGQADKFSPLLYMDYSAMVTAGIAVLYFFYLCLRVYWLLFAKRPERPMQFLMQDLKDGPLNLQRYYAALPVFIGLLFFMSAFSSMKMMIPAIHPFAWDDAFIKLDRIIHFGIDPWRILHPLLGHPAVTWLVNVVYNCWMLVLFAVLYWQAFSLSNNTVRMQFFYTFVLTWAVNGTFLATYFSSAGPCFLERLNGSDYYRPLMDHLAQAGGDRPLWALVNQNWLWDEAMNAAAIPGGGISAMPSIHVAVAFLYMLLALKLKMTLPFRIFYIAFFVLILIGSIYLGWHYAVDGYVAIIITWILWHCSSFLIRQ